MTSEKKSIIAFEKGTIDFEMSTMNLKPNPLGKNPFCKLATLNKLVVRLTAAVLSS
jgi:hypothetical protein